MVANRRNHAATTFSLLVAERAAVRGRDHVSSRVDRVIPARRVLPREYRRVSHVLVPTSVRFSLSHAPR